ncbi:MAG: hypothetical protein C0405_14920, partial [Desulfovibrio sp.]|nr:hypothetical protein [Desulfovibrio sp.]
MTLVDLTRGLFTYLVRFRGQAGQPDAPSLEKVRRELSSRFEEMGEQVFQQPNLRAPYAMVIHALAALADEVVSRSDWEHAGRWADESLTGRLFGQDQTGGDFFARLKELKNPPPDVLAIYYLCLAL